MGHCGDFDVYFCQGDQIPIALSFAQEYYGFSHMNVKAIREAVKRAIAQNLLRESTIVHPGEQTVGEMLDAGE